MVAKGVRKAAVIILGAIILTQSAQGYAWDGRNERGRRDHWTRERHAYRPPERVRALFSLGTGVFTIAFGGVKLKYCDGYYYQQRANEYILVAPPNGVIVPTLPPVYETVIVNGTPYYAAGSVYYRYTIGGYEVVPAPVVQQVVVQQPVIQQVVAQPAAQSAPAPLNEFSVNIPNAGGGYTQVVLKKSGTGYTGPQGEYYASFPSVDQLSVMYGK